MPEHPVEWRTVRVWFQRRVNGTRAQAVQPDFIAIDEPVSALGVNMRTRIVNLMIDLRERFGLAYLFIAHDLAMLRHICNRIMVLHFGQVAEIAPADDLFTVLLHPSTLCLISSQAGSHGPKRGASGMKLTGGPAEEIGPPPGCRFDARCPIAWRICAEQLQTPGMMRPRHEVGELRHCSNSDSPSAAVAPTA